MAEGRNTVAIIPLNSQNYGTWKVQAKLALCMARRWRLLMRLLWPSSMYVKTNKALAILGLSIDPTLLYLLDGIDDPKAAWKKLHDQYCKKTWANKGRSFTL